MQLIDASKDPIASVMWSKGYENFIKQRAINTSAINIVKVLSSNIPDTINDNTTLVLDSDTCKIIKNWSIGNIDPRLISDF